MADCIHCHQLQTAAQVICSECYRALTERTVSMDDKEAQGYWWCAECHEEVSPSRVTYAELHDACGHPVVYVEPKDPIAILRAQLAEQAAEVRRWKDLYESMERTWKRTEVELAAKDKQLAAAVERRAELEDALRDMVLQYCSYSGKLDHEFMSAGENAFNVLDLEYGAPTETLYRGPQEAGEVEHGN